MGGITPTLQNIAILIAALYPFFIVSFLVLASIFNFKLSGLIYLFGILITFGLCYGFAHLPMGDQRAATLPPTCDFISTLGYPFLSPSFQAAITSFTFFYLIVPMFINRNFFNPMVLITLILFSFINSIYLYLKGCANMQGLFLGALIGGIMGASWFALWYSTNKSLVFYNELASNNVVCSRPAKQTFKCNVYKNGEVISSSVTG